MSRDIGGTFSTLRHAEEEKVERPENGDRKV